ncbi:MAG: nitroreductase [Clostridiales bacterium]|nr:nitroreductase [Clostridiales bacterium]
MNEKQAIKSRHSVRAYLDKPIEQTALNALNSAISEINEQSKLSIKLVTDEPLAFGKSFLAHYGKFSGVQNYIALIGKKHERLEETLGYYGEKLVLLAQTLNLNTCWVYLTYNKRKCPITIEKGEKLVAVIAIGYGKNQGVEHKNKPLDKVCEFNGKTPAWFLEGVMCALQAPTAVNQQKFFFSQEDGVVTVKKGVGPCSKIDLGIVKYHFEIGAGTQNFKWKE